MVKCIENTEAVNVYATLLKRKHKIRIGRYLQYRKRALRANGWTYHL